VNVVKLVETEKDVKKGSAIVVLIIVLVAFFAWALNASAELNFYNRNCGVCHGTSPPSSARTCVGCHAHGAHTQIAGSGINLSAMTDKSEYAPNEDITITIEGGSGHAGWIRAKLFDQDCNAAGVICDTSVGGSDVIAVAGNPCPSCPDDSNNFGGLDGVTTGYPVAITVPAPPPPGIYTWSASWYGNRYDAEEVGGTTDFGPLWTPDPANANHGDEIVTFTFNVASGILPVTKTMPWIPLLLLD
jgi:hypothetical protein